MDNGKSSNKYQSMRTMGCKKYKSGTRDKEFGNLSRMSISGIRGSFQETIAKESSF